MRVKSRHINLFNNEGSKWSRVISILKTSCQTLDILTLNEALLAQFKC